MQDPTQTERALLRIARTLAAAVDIEDVTREIPNTALELTGAFGAYVERISLPDGTVTVIANAGMGTPPRGTSVPYPGSLTEDLIEAVEPRTLDSISLLGLGMVPHLAKNCPDCGGMVVPLRSEGEIVGALILLRERSSPQFDEVATTAARFLGDVASVALKRISREKTAREAAESGERRAHFLAAAGRTLSSSLDLNTTLQSLAILATGSIADWCVIDVVAQDGTFERVAAAHSDPAKQHLVDAIISGFAPTAASEHPAVRSLRDGDSVIINNITPEHLRSISRSDEHAAIGAQLDVSSLMSVPLRAGGEVMGAVTLVRGASSPDFTEPDSSFAEDLTSRASLAISNARHFSDAEAARGDAEQDRLELERVVESKARLIRGFSHDIKNPLGAADGYAQLLLDGLMGDLTEKQHQSISRIRAGIATALSLINDVVEFSRAESGQIEVRASPFNAEALVREVVTEHQAAAEQAGVCVRTGILAAGTMVCDAIRIRQILGNLVTNAIKYGGTDGDVVLSVDRDDDEQPRVLFSVSDAGQGIPVEKQHLLFEEFTRLHTGKKEGSGLGLAISRRIARVLGGDILVDSAEGRGSTFTLWIPSARAG